MPQPRVIKSVELPHDPDKAMQIIAGLKVLAAQHEGAKVVVNNFEAKILQPQGEALAEDEAKARELAKK